MRVIDKLYEGYLVILSPEELDLLKTKSSHEPQPHVLPIPHVSQLGATASKRRGDCGAACIAMVVNGMTSQTVTVDAMAEQWQKAYPNRYMTAGEVMNGITANGLQVDYKRPLLHSGIADAVLSGCPVVALVKYPRLPHQAANYAGCHFIVIYGVTGDVFLYHDPLTTGYKRLVISQSQLDSAMYEVVADGNAARQGLVVRK